MVIVGRGPGEAMLANLLGLSGVRALVPEREANTYHLPCAMHFDDECMRVFQTISPAGETSTASVYATKISPMGVA